MKSLPNKHQPGGLLPLLLCALTLTVSGCASQPVEVPVAVECPRPPKIDPSMLEPTPTQYLLPPELRRTARKPQ